MASCLHVKLPDKEEVGSLLLSRRVLDDQGVGVILEGPIKLVPLVQLNPVIRCVLCL